MTANIDVELAPARMPDQATLAALGAFWVRFAGLERAVDISIGILLRVGYMRMQSVTSNLNMRSKLDMVESLVALEQPQEITVEKNGVCTSSNRSAG